MQNLDMDAFAINPARCGTFPAYSSTPRGVFAWCPHARSRRRRLRNASCSVCEKGCTSFPTEELCEFSAIAHRWQDRHRDRRRPRGAVAGLVDSRDRQPPAGRRGIESLLQAIGQPTVRYGANVEKLDAAAAVEKYKPAVVVACWVTHQFDAAHPAAGGSRSGVDEASLIDQCDEYIFIGNEHVHTGQADLALPHEKITPPWLYSRAINGTRDFIAVWRREATRLI